MLYLQRTVTINVQIKPMLRLLSTKNLLYSVVVEKVLILDICVKSVISVVLNWEVSLVKTWWFVVDLVVQILAKGDCGKLNRFTTYNIKEKILFSLKNNKYICYFSVGVIPIILIIILIRYVYLFEMYYRQTLQMTKYSTVYQTAEMITCLLNKR